MENKMENEMDIWVRVLGVGALWFRVGSPKLYTLNLEP